MVIQIRIVIQVSKENKEHYPEKIDHIVAAVVKEFPDAKSTTLRSPVIVTIDEFQDLMDKMKTDE